VLPLLLLLLLLLLVLHYYIFWFQLALLYDLLFQCLI